MVRPYVAINSRTAYCLIEIGMGEREERDREKNTEGKKRESEETEKFHLICV